MAAAMCKMLHM